jgi:hypothetical protein
MLAVILAAHASIARLYSLSNVLRMSGAQTR